MKPLPKTLSPKPAPRALCVATLTFALAAGGAFAADDKDLPPHLRPAPPSPTGAQHQNLAEAATNPLANLMQLQNQFEYNFQHYNTDDTSWAGTFQPVVPIKLPSKSVPVVITRFTVPYTTTPKVDGRIVNVPGKGITQLPGIDGQSAWADIVGFGLFMPKLKTKGHQIGIGPAVSLPLASNKETGSGKWQLGPAAVYVNTVTPTIQWGALTYQLWDVADRQSDRQSVSKLFVQPFITKHFSKGWYVGTQDTLWSYNWRTHEWTVPIGPKIGRVFNIGKLPVNLFGEMLYQPSINGVASQWSAKINLTILIPEG